MSSYGAVPYGTVPDPVQGGIYLVGGLGPSSLGVTIKSVKIKNARHISRTKKYEGFGERPPIGGRPGARAPLKPGSDPV